VSGWYSAAARHRGRLLLALGISVAILVVQVVVGLVAHSLALLADAGHVFADVAGMGLALLAVSAAARPATGRRTFGWYRLEILAAVVNAVLLLAVAGFVLVEAGLRLAHPEAVTSGLMLAAALVGLGGNLASMLILRRAQAESLTMRGAYVEVLGDLLGSAAVIVAAAIIAVTGYTRADAIASIFVALLILARTWALLRDAVDVLLEGTPKGVDLDEVRRHMLDTPGVTEVHDLHAWTITSGMNVVSAHVVVHDGASTASVLDDLCACLAGDFDIEHSTFQVESEDRRRTEGIIHP